MSLDHQQTVSIESSLMQALVLIEERERLLREVAARAQAEGRSAHSQGVLAHADEVQQLGDGLRELIERPAARKAADTAQS